MRKLGLWLYGLIQEFFSTLALNRERAYFSKQAEVVWQRMQSAHPNTLGKWKISTSAPQWMLKPVVKTGHTKEDRHRKQIAGIASTLVLRFHHTMRIADEGLKEYANRSARRSGELKQAKKDLERDFWCSLHNELELLFPNIPAKVIREIVNEMTNLSEFTLNELEKYQKQKARGGHSAEN